jgi:transmembrane sensor
MTPSAEQIRSAISQQAGDWFVANEAGTLDHSERAAFVAWLKASPLHVQEYLAIALVARDLHVAANDPTLSVETLMSEALADQDAGVISLDPLSPPPESLAKRAAYPAEPPRLRLPLFVTAVAATVLLVFSWIWQARDGEFLGLSKTYRTDHGQQITWRLPDGTVVHLNTDSEITIRYSAAERTVAVDRGQVLFDVMHDGKRRFRVSSGDAHVVAVGTKFDVYRKSTSTAVTVIEGMVAVSEGEAPPAGAPGELPRDALQVAAGFQVVVDGGRLQAQPVDVQAVTAWMQRQIVFQNRPLGEVAEEFSRYSPTTIEIEDPGLRALPVSGLFDAYDIESFVTFLQTLDGVAIQRTTNGIRVNNLKSEEQESATP